MLQSQDQANIAITGTPFGGQVLSWRIAGVERLYSSPNSPIASGRAHRGGIPVIFPQFNTFGPGPRHGFARLATWDCLETTATHLVYRLRNSTETLALWPYEFEAVLEAKCHARALSTALSIKNLGTRDASFTCALHTYIGVGDLARIRLSGLQGYRYLDCAGGERHDHIDETEFVAFGSEIDRIYCDSPSSVRLEGDPAPITIRQSGFSDTVVWNPGPELAAAMPDLGAEEYSRFVCVEAAAVMRPVSLQAGEHWQGSQTLIV